MSLSDEVYKEMKRLYEGGMTQEQVATHLHVRHGQAQKILSGTRSASGLELGTFDKMFPHASVHLYGDSVSVHADHNKGSVVGVNRGTITHERDILFEIENKILSADELTAEEKVKVLQILKRR